MKKIVLVMLCFFLLINNVKAQSVSYIEEMRALGNISGQGLACDASKYHTFEMLARAILISKAKSDLDQLTGMNVYNEQKAISFIQKVQEDFYNCDALAADFDKQKIFKMVLYGDGSIKMPDGTIIEPRNEYDPTLIYQRDNNARQKYMDMYNAKKSKNQNNPALQKALREHKMRHGLL